MQKRGVLFGLMLLALSCQNLSKRSTASKFKFVVLGLAEVDELRKGKIKKAEKADLREMDLQEGDFQKAEMILANFTGSNARKADFREAKLQGAIFRRARLEGATMEKANLQGANLEKVDLTHTRLMGADLSSANLQGAKMPPPEYLEGAIIDKYTMLPEGWTLPSNMKMRVYDAEKKQSFLIKAESLDNISK